MMETTWEAKQRGLAIAHAAMKIAGSESIALVELGAAVALLTSPVKAEREQGKAMAREWKKIDPSLTLMEAAKNVSELMRIALTVAPHVLAKISHAKKPE